MSDSWTDSEKLDFLLKKALNKPSTSTSRAFFQEPSITARSFVYQEDILASSISSTAPSDLVGLTDSDLDDNGNVLAGSYAGKTSASDTSIRYYHKLPLEYISGTGGSSWQAIDATVSHPLGYADGSTSNNTGASASYGRVLQGSIPFNYSSDGSYGVTLYKNTGIAIPFGSAGGGWLVNERAGVITFYQYSNITGVDESNIVYISFYSYVGSTGSTLFSGNAITATTSNDFSAKQVFTGDVDGTTSDSLTAVQIDSRDLSQLSQGYMIDALQWGGNYDGSWRICVQKTSADGDSLATRFLVQARSGNVWVTKSSFSTP